MNLPREIGWMRIASYMVLFLVWITLVNFKLPPGALFAISGGLAAALFLYHLKWRFSLRTLLIATTFVAVVLGVLVWAVRS